MNWRTRILATIKGDPTDQLPFVPRLDIWYKANKLAGSLPAKYRDATLMEIAQDLDVGYHGVVPDFRDFESKDDQVGYALGLLNLRSLPYRISFEELDLRSRINGDLVEVEIRTPYGKINTKVLYDESMRRAGSTLAHTAEHAIKGTDDYMAVAYIFRNVQVEPAYESYLEYKEFVGERGIAVAFNLLSASPMHLVMKELMPFELFVYKLHDNRKGLELLADSISQFYEKLFEVVLGCPAEVIFSGANYDSTITSPPFFKQYITPYLSKQSRMAHSSGKYILTHTDGENDGLLEEYLASQIDIADSICPSPMTRLTIREIKKVLGNKVTIWGGMPSICLLEDSMSNYEFEVYLNQFLEDVGSGDHLIVSFADTTPPKAKFDRIEKVAKLVKSFGPVMPKTNIE
jgi:hypothetical protein